MHYPAIALEQSSAMGAKGMPKGVKGVKHDFAIVKREHVNSLVECIAELKEVSDPAFRNRIEACGVSK